MIKIALLYIYPTLYVILFSFKWINAVTMNASTIPNNLMQHYYYELNYTS